MRALLICMLLSMSLQSQEKWSTADKWWEASALALIAADWAQTRQIAKHPTVNHRRVVMWTDDSGKEWAQESWDTQQEQTNWFLPKHPSVAEVDRYFAAYMLSHVIAANLLQGKWRRGFQVLTVGMQIDAVNRNLKLGIQIRF